MTQPLLYGAKVFTTAKGKASVIILRNVCKQPAFRRSEDQNPVEIVGESCSEFHYELQDECA